MSWLTGNNNKVRVAVAPKRRQQAPCPTCNGTRRVPAIGLHNGQWVRMAGTNPCPSCHR